MKRIVFLDYVRVFACFLVMVVHASENFYGAAGATDMVGPQSYLGSEADRLWVAVTTVSHAWRCHCYDCLCISSCTDEERTDHVAILPSTCPSHLAAILHIHDTVQYASDVVGTDKRRNII